MERESVRPALPIKRVDSLKELSGAIADHSIEAAYLENPLSLEDQAAVRAAVSYMGIRWKMLFRARIFTKKDETLDEFFRDLATYSARRVPARKLATVLCGLAVMKKDIEDVVKEFPQYYLGSFYFRYAGPLFRPIKCDDYHMDGQDNDPARGDDLRVIRTYFGGSTVYRDFSGEKMKTIIPRPGSTTAHHFPSKTVHRGPHVWWGDQRFTLVLQFGNNKDKKS